MILDFWNILCNLGALLAYQTGQIQMGNFWLWYIVSGHQVLLVPLWSAPSLVENNVVLALCSGEICFLSDRAGSAIKLNLEQAILFPQGSELLMG